MREGGEHVILTKESLFWCAVDNPTCMYTIIFSNTVVKKTLTQ